MVSGLLSSNGDDDVLGLDRRLVLGVVALVVIVAVGAVAMVWMGGDDHDSNAQLDLVPQGADGVVYADGMVTEDELMHEALDGGLGVGWWFIDTGEAPSLDVVLETLDTENIDYENTTVFLQIPEEGQEDYAGSIINLGEGSQSSDLVDLLEAELGEENLAADSYNGVDIHEIDVVEAAEEADIGGVTDELDVTALITEFIGVETTAWVGTPDDDTVILGSEAAARDAIDVYQGDAEAFDNEVREAHEVSSAGPVELTFDVDLIDEPIADVAAVVSTDVASALSLTDGNPEYISSTLDIRNRDDRMMTMDVFITMERESGANDLFTLFEGFVEPDVVLDDPENVSELDVPDRAGGKQFGKHIQFEVPIFPEQLVGYVADFVDEFGPDPDPIDLVPEASTGIVSVDGNLTDAGNVTDATVEQTLAEAAAAGLLDGEYSHAPEAVFAAGYEAELSTRSATTFTGEDGYIATYVELEDDAEDVIEDDIRRELIDRGEGGFAEHHEDEDGYRHVDIYELPDMEMELNTTRYLSGFQADGETEWITPVSNDSLLLGTEAAITDAIDIYRGAGAPAETPLHENHNRTDGLITASGDGSDRSLGAYAEIVDDELGAALDAQQANALSVGYDIRDADAGTVTLDVLFGTDDEAAGDELAGALAGTVDESADDDLDAPVSERAGLTQDGQYVRLDIPYLPADLVADVDRFVTEFGGAPFAN